MADDPLFKFLQSVTEKIKVEKEHKALMEKIDDNTVIMPAEDPLLSAINVLKQKIVEVKQPAILEVIADNAEITTEATPEIVPEAIEEKDNFGDFLSKLKDIISSDKPQNVTPVVSTEITAPVVQEQENTELETEDGKPEVKDIKNDYVDVLDKLSNEVAVEKEPQKISEIKKLIEQYAEKYFKKAAVMSEYAGGGGTNAVQYANGGTMNGDLNVTGNYLSGGVNLLNILSGGGGSGDSAVNALVHANSGNWDSNYTTTSTNSARWSQAYTNLVSNSAAYLSGADLSLLASASGSWNSNYTTTNANSANWQTSYNNAIYTVNGTANQIVSTPAGSNTGNNSVTLSLPSNLIVPNNLTIQGNLTALGTSTFKNTIFTTTSALSVYNTGLGPALYVYQGAGPYDVASFYDGDGIEVLHVGNANPGGRGFVGINESFPGAELTVNGAISSNRTITALGGNSNQWNSNWTTTNGNSAAWSNWQSVSANYALGSQYVKLSGDTMTGTLSVGSGGNLFSPSFATFVKNSAYTTLSATLTNNSDYYNSNGTFASPGGYIIKGHTPDYITSIQNLPGYGVYGLWLQNVDNMDPGNTFISDGRAQVTHAMSFRAGINNFTAGSDHNHVQWQGAPLNPTQAWQMTNGGSTSVYGYGANTYSQRFLVHTLPQYQIATTIAATSGYFDTRGAVLKTGTDRLSGVIITVDSTAGAGNYNLITPGSVVGVTLNPGLVGLVAVTYNSQCTQVSANNAGLSAFKFDFFIGNGDNWKPAYKGIQSVNLQSRANGGNPGVNLITSQIGTNPSTQYVGITGNYRNMNKHVLARFTTASLLTGYKPGSPLTLWIPPDMPSASPIGQDFITSDKISTFATGTFPTGVRVGYFDAYVVNVSGTDMEFALCNLMDSYGFENRTWPFSAAGNAGWVLYGGTQDTVHRPTFGTTGFYFEREPWYFDGTNYLSGGMVKNVSLGNSESYGNYSYGLGFRGAVLGDKSGTFAGDYNAIYSNNSVALGGEGLISLSSTPYQAIVGKYNNPNNNALFVIGAGTNNTNRVNVLEVNNNSLTVTGSLSTSSTIFASGGNSNQWNSAYSTTQTISANWILDGGNSKGSNLSIGTNDNFNLTLKTNNSNKLLLTSDTLSGNSSNTSFNTGSATGLYSFAEGSGKAFGNYSHAEGITTLASGSASHSEGQNTIASGYATHAEGYGTIASGSQSHAEGQNTSATNDFTHAEGTNTLASGYASHAEGQYTTASGPYSHAEGQFGLASGYASHTEGQSTSATNAYCHAEGQNTLASGYAGHAEGVGSVASGGSCHAEGNYTIAATNASHAEGDRTTASGYASHSEGILTRAVSEVSHAAGGYTVAAHNRTWIWKGDTNTDTVSTTRTDQFLVSAAGGIFFPGKVGIGTDSVANALTVAGTISTNAHKTSQDWASNWTTTNSNSASWLNRGTLQTYLSTNNILLSSCTITNNLSVLGTIYSTTSAYATKTVTANIGDGVNTSYTVTHNFGTSSVQVAVYDNATNVLSYPTVTITSANAVSLGFSTAPALNAYRVSILGAVPSSNVIAYGPTVGTLASLAFAASDEQANITSGNAKIIFTVPQSFTLTKIKGGLNAAATGSSLIFSLSSQTNNNTAGTVTMPAGAVVADAAVNYACVENDRMCINVTQVGSTTPGVGLKVYLIGRYI